MRTQAIRDAGIFMFDPGTETMPREALTALQTKRLKQTLERAYRNVSHYRRTWDSAGVDPHAFKSLADLVRFPFTTKSDLRDNYPFGMFAVPQKELRRLHASSGTTGKPTVVGYNSEDLDCWTDLMARSLACAGALPGDILHNAYGYGLFTGGLGAHYGAERLGCTVVPVSGGATERQVTLLEDFGANVLCATPSYALNIAEVATGMGWICGSRRCGWACSAPSRGAIPCGASSSSASVSRRSTSTAFPRSSAPAWRASVT
jgi:phenylacetate-CoA ligase